MNSFEDEEFFGQDEPRYVRLRGLIHDYPRDLGILKELAQNADDGGASQLQITLDKSISKISSSLIAKSDLLSGPAVLASNDKNFEESDFTNLRNLGDSSKIRLAGKTGRFGRGFNSVYNITDFPMLLSGEYLIVLDPCEFFEESKRRGGKRWRLSHLIENKKDDILSLFTIAGYTKGSAFHEGTIFRFPIRSQTHIDNIPEKKRISEKPFTEKDFMDVFADFEKGADSLLLFLKNLLSIRCGVSEDGSTVTKWHLKIETQNIEQVQAGRSIYHKKYATADVGDLLSHLESVDGRAEKSTFVHEITVTRSEGVQLSMRWRVLTGFFGGDSGELIAKSKALIQAKERGVPGAGVAACLSRNDEHFPKIDSAVFCHLPIGGEDYSSKLPIHIHGAFDIDGSRIRLTGHGVGSAEDAKIRADWNDELIKSGVSRAYADLLVDVKKLDLLCFEEIEGCNHLYSLFPPHDVSQNAHLDRLSTETYKILKEINLFRSSYGSWHVPSDLYRLPSKFEKEFEDCLLDEGFNLANPPIPENVLRGLASSKPKEISAPLLKQHFHKDTDVDCELEKAPHKGLRKKAQLQALVRFLAGSAQFDWRGMPAALCADQKLHTFGIPKTKKYFLGTDRQRKIFSGHQDLFLEKEFVQITALTAANNSCIAFMDATTVCDALVDLVFDSEKSMNWNPDGQATPNAEWLRLVLAEINSAPEDRRPDREVFERIPLIPGDDKRLHPPYHSQTPLLVSHKQLNICSILKILNVLFFKLGSDQLSREIERFGSNYEGVWHLSVQDLTDSLVDQRDDLFKRKHEWARPEVIDPLLDFISSPESLSRIAQDLNTRNSLRSLPIFQDQTGEYDVITKACYLPGNFDPPTAPLPIRLLADKGTRPLLAALEVSELTRIQLFEDYILNSYQQQTPANQLILLKWIRDEWNHILNECANSQKRDNLKRLFQTNPLIMSSRGRLMAIQDLYDPDNKDSILKLIGDRAAFPDISFYKEQWDIWITFFREFNLPISPRVQDLVAYISKLCAEVKKTHSTQKVAPQIDHFLSYITEHWQSLAEQEVIQEGENKKVFFSGFLRQLAWCIPIRDPVNLLRFGSSSPPADRLYKPSELFLPEVGALVASQAPVLKRGKPITTEMREALAFKERPSKEIVISHLKQFCSRYEGKIVEEEDHEAVRDLSNRFLDFFGRGSSEESDSERNSITEELSETHCVYIPTERQFYRPCDLYSECPTCLAPYKIRCVPEGKQKSVFSDALDNLGRTASPDLGDYLETLHRIADQDKVLDAEQIKQFLQIQSKLLTVYEEGADISECPIIDREGRIVRDPQIILHSDDDWLEKRFIKDFKIPLLHTGTPDQIIELLGIGRISRLLKKFPRTDPLPTQTPSFHSRCKGIEALIRTTEFRVGLRRVAAMNPSFVGSPFYLPQKVDINPVESLQCVNQIEFGGMAYELATLEEDYCVVSFDNENWTIHIADSALNDLEGWLACAINEILDDCRVDKADLSMILKCVPTEIASALDRRRIRRLADDTSQDEDSPSIVIDFGDYASEDATSSDSVLVDDEGAIEPVSLEEEKAEGSTPTTPNEVAQPSIKYSEDEVLEKTEGKSVAKIDSRNSSNLSSTGQTRGRMEAGPTVDGTRKALAPASQKRVDGFWISRPCSKKEFNDARDDESNRRSPVGIAAVGWVLQYEVSQGRKPLSMAHGNPGYDIESRQGRSEMRYIEVKGIDGAWGHAGVKLSAIQFRHACEKSDQYWLYVVENATDPNKVIIHTIQNPAQKTTHYLFDHGWKHLGSGSVFKGLEPAAGLRFKKNDDDGTITEGEIIHASLGGNTWHLKVIYQGSTSVVNTFYTPSSMILQHPVSSK